MIGGRNKYLINAHTAQLSQVQVRPALPRTKRTPVARDLSDGCGCMTQNLFHSVQLNVNNPHFLIMQGRITKVLNMKPPEIKR